MINFEEIDKDVLLKMLSDVTSIVVDGAELQIVGVEGDGVSVYIDRCIPDYMSYDQLLHAIRTHKRYCEFYKEVEVTDITPYM